MFSKACEYAIRAVLYIGEQSLNHHRVGLKDISTAIDSPEAFTAKILQQLVRDGIVTSVKGPNGGFEMDERTMQKIRLSHVVKSVDGENIYKGCGLGLRECNEKKPCPVHEQFARIRSDLKRMLEATTILELAQGVGAGLTFLKR